MLSEKTRTVGWCALNATTMSAFVAICFIGAGLAVPGCGGDDLTNISGTYRCLGTDAGGCTEAELPTTTPAPVESQCAAVDKAKVRKIVRWLRSNRGFNRRKRPEVEVTRETKPRTSSGVQIVFVHDEVEYTVTYAAIPGRRPFLSIVTLPKVSFDGLIGVSTISDEGIDGYVDFGARGLAQDAYDEKSQPTDEQRKLFNQAARVDPHTDDTFKGFWRCEYADAISVILSIMR